MSLVMLQLYVRKGVSVIRISKEGGGDEQRTSALWHALEQYMVTV